MYKLFTNLLHPKQNVFSWVLNDEKKEEHVQIKTTKALSQLGPQKILDYFELALALFKEGATYGGNPVEINCLTDDVSLKYFLTLRLALDILNKTKQWLAELGHTERQGLSKQVTEEKINSAIAEVELLYLSAKKTNPMPEPKDNAMDAYLKACEERAKTPFSLRKY